MPVCVMCGCVCVCVCVNRVTPCMNFDEIFWIERLWRGRSDVEQSPPRDGPQRASCVLIPVFTGFTSDEAQGAQGYTKLGGPC